MSSFFYFAYGSNMLAERLTARCPSARSLGAATARGYEVSFCLRSSDGSAKAGILSAPDSIATGVAFEIPDEEGAALDLVEGHPHTYTRHEALQVEVDGSVLTALTYLPHDDHLIAGELLPYDWYRALCLSGAEQHGIADSGVPLLAQSASMQTDMANPVGAEQRAIALAALKAAGMHHWLEQVA